MSSSNLHTRRLRPRRGLAAAAVLTAATLGLGACAQEPLPQPRPVAAPEAPRPALDATAAERVLADLGETLAAGDHEKNTDLLAGRVTEPARALRAGQYQADVMTEGRIATPPISTTPQAVYVPQAGSFPRVMMAVTTEPEGQNLPQLLALQQSGARENYRLWGWAELFPGVTIPAMPAPQVGAEVLAPDAGGLAATPQDAVNRYVATLMDPTGADAGAFTPQDADPFKQQYRRLQDELGPSLSAAGTVTASATPGTHAPQALRTADGGALVMGEVLMSESIARTQAGSKLDLAGDYAAYLSGNGAVTGSVQFDYLGMVVLAVPAADAEDQTIQVLGASRTMIASQRDDSTNPD